MVHCPEHVFMGGGTNDGTLSGACVYGRGISDGTLSRACVYGRGDK